mmetsp:Transcript_7654/g.13514  ORF Transcript_7654/g.13514 Transcript_7654/m.13514 type:complete len:106 (+) Transcript_7654:375-692(+)
MNTSIETATIAASISAYLLPSAMQSMQLILAASVLVQISIVALMAIDNRDCSFSSLVHGAQALTKKSGTKEGYFTLFNHAPKTNDTVRHAQENNKHRTRKTCKNS